MAIWRLCTSFYFVPTSRILVAMATNTKKKNQKKSDNGGAGRGHHCLAKVLFFYDFIMSILSLFCFSLLMHCIKRFMYPSVIIEIPESIVMFVN